MMEDWTWFIRGAVFGSLVTGLMVWLLMHLEYKRARARRVPIVGDVD